MHSIFGCVVLLLGGKKSPKSQFYGASGWFLFVALLLRVLFCARSSACLFLCVARTRRG